MKISRNVLGPMRPPIECCLLNSSVFGRRWGVPGICGTFAVFNLALAIFIGGAQARGQTNQAMAGYSAWKLSFPEAGSVNTSKGSPLTLTFQDALKRAQAYAPQFQAAVTAMKMARENRLQAKDSLLPTADYLMQDLTTQGNGLLPTGRYVTNDGVHVYRAWGVFRELLSANTFTLAGYRKAKASEAVARADLEIARRGLDVAVTQAYYGLVVAEREYATAQQSLDQAKRSLKISRDLERGGQVAHSDVITFQIEYNREQQAFQEAKLAMENSRLNLAVMLFPNFIQNFDVVDDLDIPPPLPTLAETEEMARQKDPEIRSAMASLEEARAGVSVARGAFFPTLSVETDYGIEANALALRSRVSANPELGRLPNLGFFVTASLNVPLWDWGMRRSKLRQAKFQRQQARVQLTFAKRRLLSNLYAYYNEARTARSELDNLRSSADLAAQSLRLNTLRYKAGEATVLEVLNAQNTLTQARDNYATRLAGYRVALANLQTLTGSF